MDSEAFNRHPNRTKSRKRAQDYSNLTIPILPAELITEILSRLPVKSLLKFRFVSKSWLALIASPKFIKTHLSLSANKKEDTHHMLILDPGVDKWNFKECLLRSLYEDSVIEVFDLNYPFENSGSYISILGSCNGLIFVVHYSECSLLWNPTTKKYKTLPDFRPIYGNIYGFGYDELHDDYKVVDISCLFANGKLHWETIVVGPNFSNARKGTNIISFDLANEKCYYKGTHFSAWVMKEYGVKESWMKMFTISLLHQQTSQAHCMYLRFLTFAAYGQFLKANSEQLVTWKRASFMEEVLREADVISLHPVLDKTTYHLVNKERLAMMKKEAILVNYSRGPVIYEVALVEHLRKNPMFRVGLDVFEDEPYMKPGLADMKNAVVVPHIASASKGIATLAALNALIVGNLRIGDLRIVGNLRIVAICWYHVIGSFAGLGFLAWYLFGKIKTFDRRGHVYKLYLVKKGSMLCVLVAHGEGRAYVPDDSIFNHILGSNLAPVKYCGDDGRPTDVYPFNLSVVIIFSLDGRDLALMPHPKCCFLMWQFPWYPKNWDVEKISPHPLLRNSKITENGAN
ncbi:Glycerate dehydrogenase HPR, peroxisomal [Capsicum baccatum]|uniref:Glycerate dehydrogenase HPR, peroxisomal n=1 Tax=Capsicum baccatum TaxID=33114 RepID=A0A2G2VXK2_CAPBA|nr:Glycerate dehydrogenase HPR, peroxisomal [Capsicum baccatum]